jgi:hypothetical protein
MNMHMNKSLLAAALAAASFGGASSAMALNFTSGAFTGSVDISGTVTVPQTTNYWQWAAGDAINFPSIPVTQMDSTYKILTLPAPSDLPLLVGQTTAATVGNAGNAGLNPQIAFTDATDTAVTPAWDNTSNSGKGSITLPVTAADGTTLLGSMKMRVKAGALRGQQLPNAETYLDTVHSTSPPLLYGGTALPSQAAGTIATYPLAAAWTSSLGSKSATDLLDQLNAASHFNVATWTGGTLQPGGFFSNPNLYFVGAYGMGIAQGDDITVTFTNEVTNDTTWKAPLKISVTYL